MPENKKKRGVVEMSLMEDCKDIQELKAENEALKKANDDLMAENQDLKKKLAEHEEEEESDDDSDDDESVCDGTSWSKKYFLLKAYKTENGDCKVPRSHKTLGVWVKNQHQEFGKKKVSQDRVDKLNKLGFSWGKGYPEPPKWEDRFEELQKYKETFGHCNIAVSENPEHRSELAKWVLEQRKQGKRCQKHRPTAMTLDQYKSLRSLGFDFKKKTKSRK